MTKQLKHYWVARQISPWRY